MAGIDSDYNITLDKGGDYDAPFILQTEDGVQIDVGASDIALIINLPVSGSNLTLVPGAHPTDAKGRQFVFSKAFADLIPPMRSFAYRVVQTTNSGSSVVLWKGTIAADGF